MSRPIRHAATKPFKVTRAAIDEHRAHGSTPFLGCAICVRRSATQPVTVRWTSPRLAI
jgi:hypothetical protein